ncbi:MAG TPA: carboxymuconolactone decarboxylase family protein [Candidatus Onthousia faecigallinarum]|nr:carboxymuconolactone decarboxylase family protein [Candidatus Onthousia faecigallinarum]
MEIEKVVNNFIEQDIESKLDQRVKYLTLLPAWIATDSKELFQEKLKEAREEVDKESLKEAVYQTIPYLGYSKVYSFLSLTEEVLGESKSGTVTTKENRYEEGLKVQYEIFGQENIDSSREKEEEEMKFIWDYLASYCFGDFYTRKYLTIKERELITFVTLASYGDVAPQLASHIGANLKVGNSQELLIEVVKNLVPYLGFPRSLNTLNAIKKASMGS